MKKSPLTAALCVFALLAAVFVSVAVSAPADGEAETQPLHKTAENTIAIPLSGHPSEGERYEYLELDVRGYRQITIYFYSKQAASAGVEATVGFHIWGENGLLTSGGTWKSESFRIRNSMRSRTYDVTGSTMVLSLYNPTIGKNVTDLTVGYYLTT